MKSPIPNEAYTVGWVSALPKEMAAATSMLDEYHDEPQWRSPGDRTAYNLGRMGNHNVVIVCLRKGIYGPSSAQLAASHMSRTFPNLQFMLMVGIGGGIPIKQNDIRLGDVVVSAPRSGHRVMRYDLEPQLRVTPLDYRRLPGILLDAVEALRRTRIDILRHVEDMVTRYPRLRRHGFAYDPMRMDQLYGPGGGLIPRPARPSDPAVHYGPVASGSQLVKDAIVREQLAEYGIMCVEMEAAGLVDKYPCLIVRGISDYADVHKNDDWQEYAAATAAGYAKELLVVESEPGQSLQRRDLKDLVMQSIYIFLIFFVYVFASGDDRSASQQ